eukprot:2897837-Prymnesium_polylepis.1
MSRGAQCATRRTLRNAGPKCARRAAGVGVPRGRTRPLAQHGCERLEQRRRVDSPRRVARVAQDQDAARGRQRTLQVGPAHTGHVRTGHVRTGHVRTGH